MTRFLLLLTLTFYLSNLQAQELRADLGTEFPLQYFIGLNYQHGKWVSGDISIGVVTSPYNNELYDWISVPAKQVARKEFLQETTEGGSVFDFGLNLHYRKWYCGVFGQMIQLNAAGSYEYILNSKLVKEELRVDEKFTLDSILDLPWVPLLVNFEDEIALHTKLFQLGFKVGKRFQFKNPRWSARIELSITKNIYAKSTSSYDNTIVSLITNGNPNLAERLDFDARLAEVDKFFSDYGYIPGASFGISYLIYSWKKDNEVPGE